VALVAAAVASTRTMIHTSQIQSVMGEFEVYASAVRNFKNKYQALPGDFAGASAIWGLHDNCAPVSGSPAGTSTCNGNGNGIVEAGEQENLFAWRHLGLSGFLPQNYSGTTSGSNCGGYDLVLNKNVPASKMTPAVWNLMTAVPGIAYTTGADGDQYIPMNVCSNNLKLLTLNIGGARQADAAQPNGCSYSQVPLFTGSEAYEIDTKYDNKRASSGKVRAQYNNTNTYQTCEDAPSLQGGYRTDATGKVCSLSFVINP